MLNKFFFGTAADIARAIPLSGTWSILGSVLFRACPVTVTCLNCPLHGPLHGPEFPLQASLQHDL